MRAYGGSQRLVSLAINDPPCRKGGEVAPAKTNTKNEKSTKIECTKYTLGRQHMLSRERC